MFPEMMIEFEAVREEFRKGVVHTDQEAKEYKDAVAERAEKPTNPRLKLQQKHNMIHKVIRCFLARFWVQDCKVPKIEGFVASIKIKPDACGRAMQPFRLFVFD